MPAIENAILGQTSLARKRQKLAKEAVDQFAGLPNWLKSWTYTEAQTYIENNVTADPSVKVVLKGLARFCITLRDLLKQYHEEG